MDTTKWKSVLLPREVYEELVVIARVEGRTLSGQLRYMHEAWKSENLSHNDQDYIAEQVEAFKRENGEKSLTSKSFSI
jgi:macrodomain Ter protein organizer (MatP/YcbG family)